MTEQEAIKEIKHQVFMNTDNCEMTISKECYKAIIESMEKQIPRELTSIRKVKQYDGYDMGNCPICGESLDNSFYENLKYCFICGQAIKW